MTLTDVTCSSYAWICTSNSEQKKLPGSDVVLFAVD